MKGKPSCIGVLNVKKKKIKTYEIEPHPIEGNTIESNSIAETILTAISPGVLNVHGRSV